MTKTQTAGAAPQRTSQGPAAFKTAAERRKRWQLAAKVLAAVAAVAAVVYMLDSAGATTSETRHRATDFTLPASDGSVWSLSDMRGQPVILYFNEGAGCASCIYQMAAIEAEPGFAEAGIAVVPVVMDSVEHIRAAAADFGVHTPFLIDDGSVSDSYGALGTGMHPNLPGHGFVLIDADGNQVWKGDYPSMWLEPAELVGIAESALAASTT